MTARPADDARVWSRALRRKAGTSRRPEAIGAARCPPTPRRRSTRRWRPGRRPSPPTARRCSAQRGSRQRLQADQAVPSPPTAATSRCRSLAEPVGDVAHRDGRRPVRRKARGAEARTWRGGGRRRAGAAVRRGRPAAARAVVAAATALAPGFEACVSARYAGEERSPRSERRRSEVARRASAASILRTRTTVTRRAAQHEIGARHFARARLFAAQVCALRMGRRARREIRPRPNGPLENAAAPAAPAIERRARACSPDPAGPSGAKRRAPRSQPRPRADDERLERPAVGRARSTNQRCSAPSARPRARARREAPDGGEAWTNRAGRRRASSSRAIVRRRGAGGMSRHADRRFAFDRRAGAAGDRRARGGETWGGSTGLVRRPSRHSRNAAAPRWCRSPRAAIAHERERHKHVRSWRSAVARIGARGRRARGSTIKLQLLRARVQSAIPRPRAADDGRRRLGRRRETRGVPSGRDGSARAGPPSTAPPRRAVKRGARFRRRRHAEAARARTDAHAASARTRRAAARSAGATSAAGAPVRVRPGGSPRRAMPRPRRARDALKRRGRGDDRAQACGVRRAVDAPKEPGARIKSRAVEHDRIALRQRNPVGRVRAGDRLRIGAGPRSPPPIAERDNAARCRTARGTMRAGARGAAQPPAAAALPPRPRTTPRPDLRAPRGRQRGLLRAALQAPARRARRRHRRRLAAGGPRGQRRAIASTRRAPRTSSMDDESSTDVARGCASRRRRRPPRSPPGPFPAHEAIEFAP